MHNLVRKKRLMVTSQHECFVFFFASHLFNYALATYMGCPAEVFFQGGRCTGFSVLDAGGQRVFLPGHMNGGLVFELIVISVP